MNGNSIIKKPNFQRFDLELRILVQTKRSVLERYPLIKQVQVRSSITPQAAREANSWSSQSTAPNPVRGRNLTLRRGNFDGHI